MRKQLGIFSSAPIFLTLLLGVSFQDAPHSSTGEEKSQLLRRQFAVELLRAVNTAEAVDHTKFGSYSSWQLLLARHSQYFQQFVVAHEQEISQSGFADAPEISPGWHLRMNVHPDGQGYDVLLIDVTDKKCSYAAVTDEEAVIRQSKVFNCPI